MTDAFSHLQQALDHFSKSYVHNALQGGMSTASSKQLVEQLTRLVQEELQHPHSFAAFHKALRTPFDYYQFGLDLVRPLIDFKHSKVLGQEHLKSIVKAVEKGDNVILLSNHHTEIDPQIISLLLEKKAPKIAEEI